MTQHVQQLDCSVVMLRCCSSIALVQPRWTCSPWLPAAVDGLLGPGTCRVCGVLSISRVAQHRERLFVNGC